MEKQSGYVYNNFQYYEMLALTRYLNTKAESGYCLSGAFGSFMNVLKFERGDACAPCEYYVLKRHFDEEIDAHINCFIESAQEKASKFSPDYQLVEAPRKDSRVRIRYLNNYFAVLECPRDLTIRQTLLELTKKQSQRLGLRYKAALAYVSTLSILSGLGIALKLMTMNNGTRALTQVQMGLYIALILNFMLYMAGDMHDLFVSKAWRSDNLVSFSNRSHFKSLAFRAADILKVLILLTGISLSMYFTIFYEGIGLGFEIMRMWLVTIIAGYFSYLKYQRSYISLLLIVMFLVTQSFW